MSYLEQLRKESRFIQVLEVLMWAVLVFLAGSFLVALYVAALAA